MGEGEQLTVTAVMLGADSPQPENRNKAAAMGNKAAILNHIDKCWECRLFVGISALHVDI